MALLPTGSAVGATNNGCAGTLPYAQAVVGTAGVVSYWRLGESLGASACDASGTNPGSYQTGVTLGVPGALSGDPNTAVTLNGSTGWVSVPASASLNVADQFTVEAWVKRGDHTTGANEVIASKQDGDWVLMFNGSDQLVLRRSTVADVAASTVKLTDTSGWHYVVATKNGSSVHLYIDGSDVTGPVSNQTMVDNTQPLAIGQSTNVAYFNGSIDELALYRTVLTPTQITQHYNLGTGAGNDPAIAAAGDIACDTTDPNYNGGSGTTAGCQQQATSSSMSGNQLLGVPLSAVLPLGDEQYESGALSQFQQSYGPAWGRLNSIAYPTPGNHEYYTTAAAGYFDYFNGVGVQSGRAGNRSQGYYSYNIGTWHLISLNSNCGAIGDCGAGSAEEQWLKADLAANSSRLCTLAYWHHPLFTSGTETGGAATKQLFTDLYQAGADVVLNGHEHQYERFAPQSPTGALDTAHGIREFVVGTGGRSLEGFGSTIAANSQARSENTYGVLRLVLHSGSYNWQFAPASGGTFTDSGTGNCHY